tara:strand:- start:305 stop:1474 length:1170 start_codon:yes stop_codon:yes gene_type:complete
MDEFSPVFENFRNKMSAMNSRPKINRTTFNIGANVLEKRVANNSRKITIIKSILKNQKVDIGEKLTTPEPDKSTEISKELASVNSTLLSIGNILSTDFANRIAIEKGQNKLLKDQKQKRRRSLAESGIETVKKVGKGLGKITSPIREGGSNILKALSLLGLGVAGNIAFNLLENFDSEKFTKILDSIKNNFKWVVGTVGVLAGILAVKGIISAIGAIKTALAFLAAPKLLALMGIGLALYLGYKIGKPIFDSKMTEIDKSTKKLEESGLSKGDASIVATTMATQLSPTLVDGPYDGVAAGDLSQNPMAFTSNLPGDAIGNAAMGLVFNDIFPEPKVISLPPIIEKLHKNRKPVIPLPAADTANMVPYATSINVANDHMTKTPKVHGIIL